MIIIDHVMVSDEIRDTRFCCDLIKCLGSCCVEGDAGAPLEEEEVGLLEDNLDHIKPYMTPDGIETSERNGVFDYDHEGNLVTPLIRDRDCAFVYYENRIARCAIEKAFEAGLCTFQKPVSCHLYPIRIKKIQKMEAVNYHKWHICEPARTLGKNKGIFLYKFLRDPLIRRYGAAWYNKLVETIEK